MTLIDFENHYYDQSTIDAMAARKGYPRYNSETDLIYWNESLSMPQKKVLPPLLDIGDGRIAVMDKAGISTAVLSSSQGVEDLPPAEAMPLAEKANNTVYALTQKYPGRYLGSAILPTKNMAAACKELTRCVKELGFVAWHTHTNICGASIEQPEYRPIFETAAELGIYIYLHPALPDKIQGINDYGFTFAGPGAGFTVDGMLTVLKLVASGVFDDVPQTKLVLGHLGEAIPFLLDRIDNRFNFIPNAKLKNKEKPSHYFKKNIMVTTSGNMSPAAFRCAKDVLGIDHILFGSDYPFEDIEPMTNFVKNLDLTDSEREMLYFRNAEKLL